VLFVGKLLPATQCDVAPGGVWSEKSSFNPFSGKAEIQRRSNFENWTSSLFMETYILLLIYFVSMYNDTLA
jgi:hypothetical protein